MLSLFSYKEIEERQIDVNRLNLYISLTKLRRVELMPGCVAYHTPDFMPNEPIIQVYATNEDANWQSLEEKVYTIMDESDDIKIPIEEGVIQCVNMDIFEMIFVQMVMRSFVNDAIKKLSIVHTYGRLWVYSLDTCPNFLTYYYTDEDDNDYLSQALLKNYRKAIIGKPLLTQHIREQHYRNNIFYKYSRK
jgi:hypothetical protein